MKYFEKQALLDEFSYATEDGSVLTYKDIEAILDHFDDSDANEKGELSDGCVHQRR